MALFKKPIKFADEEEISRGVQKPSDNRLEGNCIEMIRGACNSVTHRPMLADKEILQVKSGLSLQGKKRILLTFVLDCSMSMGKEVYRMMYSGIAQLAEIMAKTDSMKCADISIITVEQSRIMLRQDFAPCTADIELPDSWKCGKGLSPVLSAVYLANKRGLRRKQNYSFGRINCYRPLTIVISDFKNNDDRYQGITSSGIEEMLQELNDSQDSDILKVCTQQGNPLYEKLQGAELKYISEDMVGAESITEWFHDLYMMLRQMFHNQDHPVKTEVVEVAKQTEVEEPVDIPENAFDEVVPVQENSEEQPEFPEISEVQEEE